MRRIRLDNLSLDLAHAELRLENPNLPNLSAHMHTYAHVYPSPFSLTSILDPAHLLITYHAQQPPRCVARLRTNTNPVPRAARIKLDVFPRPPVRVTWPWRLRDRVVCAEDFEGPRVARCAGVCDDDVVDGCVFAPEARETDAEDHFSWDGKRRRWRVVGGVIA